MLVLHYLFPVNCLKNEKVTKCILHWHMFTQYILFCTYFCTKKIIFTHHLCIFYRNGKTVFPNHFENILVANVMPCRYDFCLFKRENQIQLNTKHWIYLCLSTFVNIYFDTNPCNLRIICGLNLIWQFTQFNVL